MSFVAAPTSSGCPDDVKIDFSWQIRCRRIALESVRDPIENLTHDGQRVKNFVGANSGDARGDDVADAVHAGLNARKADSPQALEDLGDL